MLSFLAVQIIQLLHVHEVGILAGLGGNVLRIWLCFALKVTTHQRCR